MQSQRQEEKQGHDPADPVQVAQPSPARSREYVHDYAYYKEVFSGHAMPFAYLDLDLLEQNKGAGEVQTPIRYEGTEQLNIGDPVFLRHAKAGELCERFTRLLLVTNGTIVDEVTTYRGDGQCFI